MMPGKVNMKHAGRLAAHLLMQRERGKYCDVCICIGEKRFLAHKCVLSANSNKLDGLILDAIGQNRSSQDIEIEIKGVSPIGFETLVEHFYTGDLNLQPDTVMAVWMAAAYLELPNVVSLCNDYCQQTVVCISNQASSDGTSKVSEMNNNNEGSVVVTGIDSSESNIAYSSTMNLSPTDGQEEETGSKYSAMTTVTASTLKVEQDVDPPQAHDQKILSTDENAITWTTPVQNAMVDYETSTGSTQPDFQQYQNSTNTWSHASTSWSVPTYTAPGDVPTYTVPGGDVPTYTVPRVDVPTYTVPGSENVIKSDPETMLEDGEIAMEPESNLITHPESSVTYIQSENTPSIVPPRSLTILDVNKMSEEKTSTRNTNVKPECENMMLEVEALRIQHQQLQRLQQQKASLNGTGQIQIAPQHIAISQPTLTPLVSVNATIIEEPAKKKAKKKKFNTGKDFNSMKADNSMLIPVNSQQAYPELSVSTANQPKIIHTNLAPVMETTQLQQRGVNPPADFRFITNEYRESLYHKYPIRPESPMSATCTAGELLQRGKSRKRKSTEQNALNNTIRLILDTMAITESSDPTVEDALILIMDRFESLRNDINDPTVRRSLLVKVRHSIHCKKWRVKKQLLKGLIEKEKELGATSAEDYNVFVKQHENEDSLHG